jgi:hypothetical protein
MSLSTIVAVASGPYFAACGLLVVTGAAKVRQPVATATALRAAIGFEAPLNVARGIGGFEIALGVAGATVGGAMAIAVAALYGAFIVVAVQLRRRAPDTACGCIGERSGQVGAAHVISSAAAIAIALTYGANAGGGIVGVVRGQPFAGGPYLALVACCVGLVSLFLTTAGEERTWQH